MNARGPARALPLVLVLAPALGWGAAWWVAGGDMEPPVGDRAVLEMYTRLATEGAQLLGPYSRFHVHHPGPAFFYASAPLYALLGGRTEALPLAALAWNTAALALLLRYAGSAGAAGWPAAACLLLAFTAARGPAWLWSPWNPNLAVLPFGAALFACARVAAGRLEALPAAAVFASLAVQTHLATGPALAAVALVTVVLWIRGSRLADRPGAGGHPARVRVLGTTVAILSLLWALPVIEQLTAPEGNLGRLLATASRRHEPRPLGEAVSAVSGAFVGFIASSPRRGGSDLPVVVVVLSCGALVLACVRLRRRGEPFAAALGVLCLAGLAAGLEGTRQAAGRLMPYLLRWVFMLTVGAGVAVSSAFAGGLPARLTARVRPWMRAVAWTLAVGLAAALGSSAAAEGVPRASAIVQSLRDQLDARRGLLSGRFLVEVAGDVDREVAVGLLLALDKRGLDFAIDPFGPFRFGGHWRPTGHERGILRLDAARGAAPVVATAEGVVASWRGD